MKKGLTLGIAYVTLVLMTLACQTQTKTDEISTQTQAATKDGAKETPKNEAKTTQTNPSSSSNDIYKLTKLAVTYPDGMVIQSRIFLFDKSGVLQSEEVRGLQDILTQKKTYTYGTNAVEINSVNNISEFLSRSRQILKDGKVVKELQLNAKNEELSSEEFTFDDKGIKTARVLSSRTGGQSKTDYVYENGLLRRTVLKDSAGNTILSIKKLYDSNKRLITEEEYNNKDVLISKTVYTYDNGFLFKKESQNEKGIAQNFYTYEYDSLGNISQIKYYNRQGKLSEITIQEWKSLTELAK